MLYLLITIAAATIPDAAWRAAERENYQQSVYEEEQIVTLLQKACKQGHKAIVLLIFRQIIILLVIREIIHRQLSCFLS